MDKQKKRIQARIRAWYKSTILDMAQGTHVSEWTELALWHGMESQCAKALGVAESTIRRYFNGAVCRHGTRILTFDAILLTDGDKAWSDPALPACYYRYTI